MIIGVGAEQMNSMLEEAGVLYSLERKLVEGSYQ